MRPGPQHGERERHVRPCVMPAGEQRGGAGTGPRPPGSSDRCSGPFHMDTDEGADCRDRVPWLAASR